VSRKRLEQSVKGQPTDCIRSILSLLDEDADQAYIGNLLHLIKQHDPSLERTIFVPTSLDPSREDEGHVRDLVLLKSANFKLSSSSGIPPGPWWDNSTDGDIPDLDSFKKIKQEAALANPKRVDFLKRAFTGIGPMGSRLAQLLCSIAAEEIPKQQQQVVDRVAYIHTQLGKFANRGTHEYRCKLIKIASEFQRIVHETLENRDYPSSLVKESSEQSLVQNISDLNLGFSALMWSKGHTGDFATKLGSVNEGFSDKYEARVQKIYSDGVALAQMQGVFPMGIFDCQDPSANKPIADTIEKCYKDSRKAELGTVSSFVFRRQ
jgi:hypothetical protein